MKSNSRIYFLLMFWLAGSLGACEFSQLPASFYQDCFDTIDSLYHSDPIGSYTYADSARIAAEKENKLLPLGISHYWLGDLSRDLYKFSERVAHPISHARISVSIFSELKQDLWHAKSEILLASVFYFEGQYDSLTWYLDQAESRLASIDLNHSNRLNLLSEISLYRAAGLSTQFAEDTDSLAKANRINQQVITDFGEVGNKSLQAIALRNLALIESDLEQLDQAEARLIQAQQLNQEINSNIAISTIHRELGRLYLKRYAGSGEMQYFRQSMDYLDLALSPHIQSSCQICELKAINYHMVAYYAFQEDSPNTQQWLDSAQKAYEEGIIIAGKEGDAICLDSVIKGYQELCTDVEDCQLPLDSIKKAFHRLLAINEQSRSIAESNFYEHKKNTVLRANRNKFFTMGGAALAFLILLFLGLFNRSRVIYLKRQLETQLEALSAQMNPHFISNSLAAIESLIKLNRNNEASSYLIKFAHLSRKILKQCQAQKVSLKEENQILMHYLALEQLRLGHKFTYEVKIEGSVTNDLQFIPPMMVQPFVENAVWHGIQHKKENGFIRVTFKQNTDNSILVLIEDNGIGRDKAREFKSNSVIKDDSFSTKIIKERIQILKRNGAADLVIEDLKNEHGDPLGTRVRLILTTLT